MKRFFCLFFVFCLFAVSIPVSAQNRQLSSSSGAVHGLRRQALVINIESRVLEDNKNVVWSEVNRKVSIPGVPIGIQLAGSNVVVATQFTPYIRRDGNVLVAQGQIWIADPNAGGTYYTSIQTIPLEFDVPIYFYPLGSSQDLSPSIEIIITVNRYNEANASEEGTVSPRNDR